MRRFLYWLTGHLPLRVIIDDTTGIPFLERYFIARLCGVSVYVHRFIASDPDRGLHDHPWNWACSFVLKGWYYDERRAGTKQVAWFNRLDGDAFHRVLLPPLQGEVWTLFVHGPNVKGWGFLRDMDGYHHLPEAKLYVGNSNTNDREWWHGTYRGWQHPWRQAALHC